MEIKILKIISGEEIISQCEFKEGRYILKNPQKFLLTQEGVASMPMMPFSSSENYQIDEKHVIFVCEPELEIRNMYNSKYGSGVVLPSSGKIQLS
jgi:hypothetical protein